MALPGLKSQRTQSTSRRKGGRKSYSRKHLIESDNEEEKSMAAFPIVLTTYDMIIKDRVHLQHYNWGYIVVDEGHRLKNLYCKLMQEIKKYKSAGRMILTGTPLHVSANACIDMPHMLTDTQNNLAELWSLLNFILPDIFNDIDSFQEWYADL